MSAVNLVENIFAEWPMEYLPKDLINLLKTFKQAYVLFNNWNNVNNEAVIHLSVQTP